MKNNVENFEEVLGDVFSKILGVDINLIHIDEVLKEEQECNDCEECEECNDCEECEECNEYEECEECENNNSDIDTLTSMRDRFDLAESRFFDLEEGHLSIETTRRYVSPKTNEMSFESITELKSSSNELKTIARRTTKETFIINDSEVEENEVFKKEDDAYVCKSTRVEECDGRIYKSEIEVNVEFFDCQEFSDLGNV